MTHLFSLSLYRLYSSSRELSVHFILHILVLLISVQSLFANESNTIVRQKFFAPQDSMMKGCDLVDCVLACVVENGFLSILENAFCLCYYKSLLCGLFERCIQSDVCGLSGFCLRFIFVAFHPSLLCGPPFPFILQDVARADDLN